MKGIAHFAVGVAVTTFFAEILHDAAQGLAFGPVLGGIAGLLPDTLDFKLLRYLDRPDVVVDPARFPSSAPPGAGLPDPQPMAEAIADAADRAHESGRRVRIQLHTLRLGSDLWRRWFLGFEPAQRRVHVRLGPVVTTGQVPLAGSAPQIEAGSAPLQAPLRYPDGEEIVVDIFSGPSLAFEPAGQAVEVVFLPWHRAWTHSVLMALLVGLLGSLLAPVYGLALALAVLAHVLVDQLGFMGSNLAFPLTRGRTRGLGWFHSGEALPNLATVWICGTVILFNLDRFSGQPTLAPWPYFLLALALPGLLLLGATRGAGRAREGAVPARMGEALDEAGEVDI